MQFDWNSPSDPEPMYGKRSKSTSDRLASCRGTCRANHSGSCCDGIALPSTLLCLNLGEQLAQKRHACTAPCSAARDRNVLDILEIELLGKLRAKKVRAAAKQVFEQRATHPFLPTMEIAADWEPELEVLANALGYLMTPATEIEAIFRPCVESPAKVYLDLPQFSGV